VEMRVKALYRIQMVAEREIFPVAEHVLGGLWYRGAAVGPFASSTAIINRTSGTVIGATGK
jgi:hypothetical protein